MKRNTLIFVIGVLLIAVFLPLLFTFQVRQSEIAVITTFGSPTRPVGPGLHLKWPWPIQLVYKLDQRTQTFEDKLTQDYTGDNNTLLTSVFVGWRISDPNTFFPKFKGSIPEAESTLNSLVSNAKKATVGRHPLSHFISTSSNGTNFVAIEDEMLSTVRSQADKYGIAVEFLGIKKLELPDSVTQAVFDQMTSERQRLANQLQYDGERLAQQIRSDAQRQAAEMLAGAQGQAKQIEGQGYAEAAKSLAVFQQNPELASFLFRLNALESLLKENAQMVLDQSMPPLDLFRGLSTNSPAR